MVITMANRPMDTNVLELDINTILRWIQMFHMTFYYSDMTMRMVRKWFIFFFLIQSVRVTAAFDIPANSTNGKNLVVTNLHSSNFV
jgi:hypothetical protein